MVVVGPIDLLQGGTAVMGRLPIYNADLSEDNFWGFATVVMELQPLFELSGILPQPNDIQFALRGKDGRGENGEVFYGDQSVFAQNPVLSDVRLPYGKWQLGAIPNNGWTAGWPGRHWFYLLSIAIAVLSATLLFLLLRSPAQLQHMVDQATQALQKSQSRFRKLYDDSPVMMCSINSAGQIINVSNYWLSVTSRTREEVIDVYLTDLLDDQSANSFAAEVLPTLLGEGKVLDAPLKLLCANKKTINITLSAVSEQSSDGGDEHFLVVMTDVTERMQTEEALRQSQKMESVGQLTGGIAHDFNNLLGIILGSLDTVSDKIAAGERKTHFQLQRAISAVNRGISLTHRLLAFSRKQQLDPVVTNINDVVSGIEDLIHRTVEEMITISIDLESDLWNCEVDISQLENALLNLIINSRDAMPEGGHLVIKTANLSVHNNIETNNASDAPAQFVSLSVKDNGHGIPKEIRTQIFDPFFTTKDIAKGSGLGLSMVFGFVKQSGGRINVDSETGEGTRIEICLPRVSKPAARMTEIVESEDQSTRRLRVLLTEDNPEMRNLVTEMLSRLGHHVTDASDGRMAVELLEQGESFDILLTDAVLPGDIDGIRLAKTVFSSLPDIKVIIMSGYARDIIPQTMEGREIAFLQKPFRLSALSKKIKEVTAAA